MHIVVRTYKFVKHALFRNSPRRRLGFLVFQIVFFFLHTRFRSGRFIVNTFRYATAEVDLL